MRCIRIPYMEHLSEMDWTDVWYLLVVQKSGELLIQLMCSLSTIFNWILAPSQVVLSDFFQQQCCEFYHVCSLSSPPCDDVSCFVAPPGCTRNLYMHSPRTVHQKEIHPGTQMTPEAPKIEDMAGFQWNIDLQFYMSRREMSQSSIFNLPPPTTPITSDKRLSN